MAANDDIQCRFEPGYIDAAADKVRSRHVVGGPGAREFRQEPDAFLREAQRNVGSIRLLRPIRSRGHTCAVHNVAPSEPYQSRFSGYTRDIGPVSRPRDTIAGQDLRGSFDDLSIII